MLLNSPRLQFSARVSGAEVSVIRGCPNFVAGECRESESTQRLDVTNPATGETLTELPLTKEGEVDAAVASAREAFASWSETPVVERARVLFRFKQKLEEHRSEEHTS